MYIYIYFAETLFKQYELNLHNLTHIHRLELFFAQLLLSFFTIKIKAWEIQVTQTCQNLNIPLLLWNIWYLISLK